MRHWPLTRTSCDNEKTRDFSAGQLRRTQQGYQPRPLVFGSAESRLWSKSRARTVVTSHLHGLSFQDAVLITVDHHGFHNRIFWSRKLAC